MQLKRKKTEGRKLQLFLGNPKGLRCLAGDRKQLLCMPRGVTWCNNFPVPPSLSQRAQSRRCVMLRAPLAWLGSPDCFQACVSHLAAHAAAGGQSAASLFCQTSESVSDTESGNKKCTVELQISAGCLCFSVVIGCDRCSVLAVIE